MLFIFRQPPLVTVNPYIESGTKRSLHCYTTVSALKGSTKASQKQDTAKASKSYDGKRKMQEKMKVAQKILSLLGCSALRIINQLRGVLLVLLDSQFSLKMAKHHRTKDCHVKKFSTV